MKQGLPTVLSGVALVAALDSITDAGATNRYLMWVARGVYNERVTMEPSVMYKGVEGL